MHVWLQKELPLLLQCTLPGTQPPWRTAARPTFTRIDCRPLSREHKLMMREFIQCSKLRWGVWACPCKCLWLISNQNWRCKECAGCSTLSPVSISHLTKHYCNSGVSKILSLAVAACCCKNYCGIRLYHELVRKCARE